MIHQIEQFLLNLANHVSIEVFIAIGAFAEEVVSPIPSAIVMITAGGILDAQTGNLYYLPFLALIGAFAKLCGSLLLYFIADKFEDLVLVKFGKFFGVNHSDVEGFGKKFKGNLRDYFLLAGLYVIPVIPSGPVSVLSGFFKIPLKIFVVGNLIGTYFKTLLYLYIGFTGADFYAKWSDGLATTESYIQFGMVALIAGGILWWKLRK
jgi:membrane protein DedA with SNARE-associated domain